MLPMAVETVLLAAFAIEPNLRPRPTDHGFNQWWLVTVASIAMGLQNATITPSPPASSERRT